MKFKKEVVFLIGAICLLSIGVFAQEPILDKSITAGETVSGNFITYEDSPHQTIGALQSNLEQETTYEIKNLIDEVIYHEVDNQPIQNYELVLFPSTEITDESLFNSLNYPDIFLVSDDSLSTTYNAEINEIIPGSDSQALKNLGDSVMVSTMEISLISFDGVTGDLMINGGGSTWDMYPIATNIPTIFELEQAYGASISDIHSVIINTGGVEVVIVVFDLSGTYYWIAQENDEPWDLSTTTTYYGFSSTTDNYDALAFATEGNYDVWVLI